LLYSCAFSSEKERHHILIIEKLPVTEQLKLPDDFPEAIRWQIIHLNPNLLKREKIVKGEKIILNLSNDISYIGKIEKIEEKNEEIFTIMGEIENYQTGRFTIMINGKDAHANIRIPEDKKMYRILTDVKRDKTYLLEMDSEEYILDPDDPRLDLPPDTPFIEEMNDMVSPAEEPDTPAPEHRIKNKQEKKERRDK